MIQKTKIATSYIFLDGQKHLKMYSDGLWQIDLDKSPNMFPE